MAGERKEYVLTDDQYARLMAASQPVPYLVVGGIEPETPHEKAFRIWRQIADELGIEWHSVRRGEDDHHFTATASLHIGGK